MESTADNSSNAMREFGLPADDGLTTLYALTETNATERLCAMTKDAIIVVAEMAAKECQESTFDLAMVSDNVTLMYAIDHLARSLDPQWGAGDGTAPDPKTIQ
ncbi:hypothetical protein VC83_08297 [Pseudogymnoascus destructans]|uniref:Uncharacterized protein n=1 Tax=Pseudogymnoascus destructans TaxID=655981 RepID=A0A177A1F7_9PEZI|nr:uncharacterized protein VC83_08297 [Pseudogymnoascus destructans]OAF55420.1 hypothetical protein VC83_08297 [Pseudogymnoascus destructans]